MGTSKGGSAKRARSSREPVEEPTGVVDGDGQAPTEAFQAAALQMISAARAMLEAAERAIQDPQVVAQLAHTLSGVAKGVVGTLGSLKPPGAATPPDPDPPIEHIDLD